MANGKTYNVVFVDTTGYTHSGPAIIESVKYIGNTSGTASLTAGISGSGQVLWKESGASNQAAEEVCIVCADGFHVAVTNSAQVIIYLK